MGLALSGLIWDGFLALPFPLEADEGCCFEAEPVDEVEEIRFPMKAEGPLYAAFETIFWNLALPFTVVGDCPPKEPLKELGGLLINVVGWISALASASSSDESTPRNFGPSSSESRLMTTFG